MGLKIPIPGFLRKQLDNKAASQMFGTRWAWLADIRAPLDAIDPKLIKATPEAYADLVGILTDSPLSIAQLRVLSSAARDAITTKEQK